MTSQSALMLNRGATFLSKKQYKAKDNSKIYELHGKFEIFPLEKKYEDSKAARESPDFIASINTPYTNNTGVNEVNDNNIAVNVNSLNIENQITGCIRISIRSGSNFKDSDSLQTILENNQPGSISVLIFTNGLVKIYTGNTLTEEANFPASNSFE